MSEQTKSDAERVAAIHRKVNDHFIAFHIPREEAEFLLSRLSAAEVENATLAEVEESERRKLQRITALKAQNAKLQASLGALVESGKKWLDQSAGGPDPDGRQEFVCVIANYPDEDTKAWSAALDRRDATRHKRAADRMALHRQNAKLRELVRQASEDSHVTSDDEPGCFYCDRSYEHAKSCPARDALGGE